MCLAKRCQRSASACCIAVLSSSFPEFVSVYPFATVVAAVAAAARLSPLPSLLSLLSPPLLLLLLLLQATRLAVSRARPPLAACARVWALRQGPLGRLEPGGWATHHHIAAAAKERAFWSKVCFCIRGRGALAMQSANSSSSTLAFKLFICATHWMQRPTSPCPTHPSHPPIPSHSHCVLRTTHTGGRVWLPAGPSPPLRLPHCTPTQQLVSAACTGGHLLPLCLPIRRAAGSRDRQAGSAGVGHQGQGRGWWRRRTGTKAAAEEGGPRSASDVPGRCFSVKVCGVDRRRECCVMALPGGLVDSMFVGL